MKKLLIFPLLLGVFSMCFAHSAPHLTNEIHAPITCDATLSPSFFQVLATVIPKYQEVYGIVYTIEELQEGYDDGTVVVFEVAEGVYSITISGNDLIVTLDEF